MPQINHIFGVSFNMLAVIFPVAHWISIFRASFFDVRGELNFL
ncbi:hypothetical protein PROVRUST_06556 [Providencia rustigianii DSM 4541]|uniref:Uncharacterized protein n=1 Tax=Providencia rustigianii DSM 4541 TaxID=500637 RepID=D1P2X6_9GAMM|nr:hypothetical protein PROVRUST_06556 [Providencia rustigianii DSM 4541]